MRENAGGTLLPSVSRVSHFPLRAVALALCVSVPLIGCRGRSPDAGGDTSLARDLAEVQMGASNAARPVSAMDTGVAQFDSLASTPPTLPQPEAASSVGSALAASRMRATASAAHAAPSRVGSRTPASSLASSPASSRARETGPCASPATAMQTACLTAGIRRSNSRVASLYVSIVRAVRREQRVPEGGRDPAYVSQLRRAEDEWLAWRDSECKRRSSGYSGTLWAVPRTKCIAEVTETRATELDRVLRQAHRR